MRNKTVHESGAQYMSAEDVWDDALQVTGFLKKKFSNNESIVHLDIPLSCFLSAVNTLSHDELMVLHKRIEERLAM